ncbi:MAG: UDP-N-acetylglucosamine 1-carboxyvinyltransferase [Candidatus Gottesmanbacteria bacterium]|nr:UDP-N-acetylglucosamine 1-carboxyvinyltransferase [Candidatus Gottesmanbacteria bacterium]
MDTFIITGGTPLQGEVTLGGAKNVALKVLVACLLTDEKFVIHNVPDIRDVQLMVEVLLSLGVHIQRNGSTVTAQNKHIDESRVPLDIGARLRTSSMVIGPLLARYGRAMIPNPGGCRIGARPIDRHILALRSMGALIDYRSDDGYFYATAPQGLSGISFEFTKNSHTGTETILLASVLAKGKTMIKGAAEEVEVDELIALLNSMGAKIWRSGQREITIEGVTSLHGVEFTIMPDRNEEVTFAIASAVTHGSVTVVGSQRNHLSAFLTAFTATGGVYEAIDQTRTRYGCGRDLRAIDIETKPHPGFMTDWQAPWAVLMTQATGTAIIHETVFENRFGYAEELKKMGANIENYDPDVSDPAGFYNFNWEDHQDGDHHAIRIHGPTKLHNAILTMNDLRAGATLVLAALAAQGQSTLHGVEHIDRGYENIEERLRKLGANIVRQKEEVL